MSTRTLDQAKLLLPLARANKDAMNAVERRTIEALESAIRKDTPMKELRAVLVPAKQSLAKAMQRKVVDAQKTIAESRKVLLLMRDHIFCRTCPSKAASPKKPRSKKTRMLSKKELDREIEALRKTRASMVKLGANARTRKTASAPENRNMSRPSTSPRSPRSFRKSSSGGYEPFEASVPSGYSPFRA